MSKRFENKRLLIIFGVLAVILLLTLIFKVPRENATLKGSLAELDTADAFRIVIHPRTGTGEPFEFVKEKGVWTVRQGSIISKPSAGAVQNIFSEIVSLKPQSLASVDKSKWKEYDLTDSLATRVQLLDSRGKKLADLLIGRLSYKQVASPYGYSYGNNIEGTSFVRIYGEKEVYAVDGFLAFTFSGRFSDWRDKTLFSLRKEDITRVTFSLPGDSSFILIKKESGWFAGDLKADSATVSGYLEQLRNISGGEIDDGFRPVSNPEYQVSFEGNNLLNASVKFYRNDSTGGFLLNSNVNPDIFFRSGREGIFRQIVKSREHFVKK